ncbi:response regulator [Roseiarcus sp.]|uniref:response regulator n=1 Tax=Roseiarcus sp. TaxID=1969460 RepID=UPI003F99668D
MSEDGLTGQKILIVEDEFVVADSLAMYLESLGAAIVGPASSVAAAVDLIRAADRLDVAILDVNLQGQHAFPVADALIARGVPFVFVTGYGPDSIPKRYGRVPRLTKPFQADELVKLLGR